VTAPAPGAGGSLSPWVDWMQSESDIFKWVVEILVHEFDFRAENLHPETHLVNDLDLDSIDAIDMAVRIEEKTHITLSGDDLQSIQTIQNAVELIHERL
jgi:acyl carrier protein